LATLLYRLGRFSYRRGWMVIGVWVVLLIAILGGGIALGGQTQESFAIPGTESQNALDKLDAVFPSVAGASAQAVYEVPAGASVNDAPYKAAIEKMATTIEKIPGVDTVISPYSPYAGKAITPNGQIARTQVQFTGNSSHVSKATLEKLTATAATAKDAGITANFGGQVFQNNTFGITITEVFGVIFAGVVLLITFGSLVSAGMPLLSALVGVGIVIGGITTVSAFTSVSSTAPMLALMIGLAVGIDYALFILSRHRTQLARGEDPQESAATAVGTAGSAVVFAGVTVIIALLGLLVVGIPFLSVMGVGAAFAVLVAMGVATTLLPALLGLAKGRLAPKPGSRTARRATAVQEGGKPTMGLRWVKAVMRHPIFATIAVIGILGTVAIPALSMDLNLPDGGSQPVGSTQRQAYDQISKGFGPGYNGPLVVAVDITQTTNIQGDLAAIGKRLGALNDVAYVSQGIPDPGLDTAIIQVIPKSAPDAVQTKALVGKIRNLAPSIKKQFDTPISVTGATAVGIDISNRLTSALIPFGLIVVGLSVLLLMMVFRSVLVPIKAALGFLLSVVASFGVVVAIFQWGWLADLVGVAHPGPILSFMPILLMAVLFGLAMDYEVFLVSGMREEYVKTRDARSAVSHGFANGARVVTAAALIMFFVFFAFVPDGSGSIKPIALGLATGIAFDAFLVRMTLVPAIMTLLGKAAWWMPAWLSRLLPNMDIEGEKLREHQDAVQWASGEHDFVISTDSLVFGGIDHPVGPLSFTVPAGALVLVRGALADRRLFAATLGGHLESVSGYAQLGGHPLPSESTRVARLVAAAEVGGFERTDNRVTLGDLLTERLQLTQPWYRSWFVRRRVLRLIGRLTAVGGGLAFSEHSQPQQLPQFERAVALSLVAIAERTPVVMLDQLDPFAAADDERAFVTSVCALAELGATVVIGIPAALRSDAVACAGGRTVVDLDLDSLTHEFSFSSETTGDQRASHTSEREVLR
jgi:RND superfamily putative drug exporter